MAVKRKKEKDDACEADTLVHDYLKKTNRPYSINDVFNNLHGKVGKTQVQKSLANLVANGDITQKVYGKQIVFVVKQDDGDRPSQKELDQMDDTINELKTTMNEVKEEFKELNGTLGRLKSSLTIDELRQRIKQLLLETKKSEERLKVLREGTVFVSEEERKKIHKAFETSRQAWKLRKKMCKEILDVILESSPQSPKELMESMGLETDEMVGVDINEDPLKNI